MCVQFFLSLAIHVVVHTENEGCRVPTSDAVGLESMP